MTADTIGVTGRPHTGLSARLASLIELTRIGKVRAGTDGFSPALLADSEALLRRSGERTRMSATHTVVALAGGTGSGKSSLFNVLSGATFSPSGVTRPTTKFVHSCVWGMEGAAPLLDWLGVQRRHRYGRASALDEGESTLTGLLLLDLPDHDSVVTGSGDTVDRLVQLADMLIWVLDPLKYADAAVHRRYLVPLAGHAAVTSVVLNQSDTLTPEQIDDCESDLRRLLESEGLADTNVLVTSARTGAGLDDLKLVLADAVAARQAATNRITADIDALLDRYAAYSGGPVPGWEPGSVALTPARPPAETVNGGHEQGSETTQAHPPWEQENGTEPATGAGSASGTTSGNGIVSANGAGETATAPWEIGSTGTPANDQPAAPQWQPWETTAPVLPPSTARPPWDDASPEGGTPPAENTADYVPIAPAASLTSAFARAAGVGAITEAVNGARERRAASMVGWPPGLLAARLFGRGPMQKLPGGADVAQAQRSDIDNAITVFADELGRTLPLPWSRTVRESARSRAHEVQAALGAAVTRELPRRDKVTGWWRLIALAQWLLLLLAFAGLVWIALILASGNSRGSGRSLLHDTSLTPWLGVMVVALLLLGWLISSWCQNMVVLAADREREHTAQVILSRVGAVTSELVLTPVGRELHDYELFRTELATARTVAGLS